MNKVTSSKSGSFVYTYNTKIY